VASVTAKVAALEPQRSGFGPDDGGGVSGQPHIIGTVVAPILLTKTDPEYSDEARREKVQGVVEIRIDVDANGRPRNIRVVHGLGLGLDERAAEAVAQWKFKAGTVNGKPAVTQAVISCDVPAAIGVNRNSR